MNMVAAIERLALTLWIGGMWIVGYVVVPLLFHALHDDILAGELAGNLFGTLSWLGLACGILLLSLEFSHTRGRWHRSWRLWALLTMLFFTVIGAFVLLPAIVALKQALPTLAHTTPRFVLLHGISSTLFLINSLLGLALVIFGPSRTLSIEANGSH